MGQASAATCSQPDTHLDSPTLSGWLPSHWQLGTCGQTVNQMQTFHSSAPLRGLSWPLFWPCGPFYRLRKEQQKGDSSTVHTEMKSWVSLTFDKIWPHGISQNLCIWDPPLSESNASLCTLNPPQFKCSHGNAEWCVFDILSSVNRKCSCWYYLPRESDRAVPTRKWLTND